MANLRRVVLHGELADRFGSDFDLVCDSVGEAVRGLEANRPGFMAHLMESGERGIGYGVVLTQGRKRYSLDETQLTDPLGSKTLHFYPLPVGGSDNPTLNIILGVVLIIAAVALWWTAPLWLGGLAAYAGSAAAMIAGVGLSLALGGISALIAGNPQLPTNDQDKNEAPDEQTSYFFRGAVNTSGQGRPIPVLIGRMKVGSHVVSTGIYTA